MVKTHKDYLVENHGLAPQWNPRVGCACGRFTSADMCVDLTPLPVEYRQALGLDAVDYLCDGCITRLFREQLVSEEEFYALLGADKEALLIHSARDVEHGNGLAERHPTHLPRLEQVTLAKASGGLTRSAPIIPLKCREMRSQQAAQFLAYKYMLTNVIQPPDRAK